MPDRNAAPRLLFVQERFDQQGRRQDLVARRIEQVRARYVRRTHRLALAAAQAILDRIGNARDVALLHDQRLVAHQAEARRVRVRHVGAGHQLALVESPFGIDRVLVAAKTRCLFVGQELELRDADAVLARDHAAQVARDLHDAGNRGVRSLQHHVVVGIDGNVGVNIAVARVHVQRYEHAAAQHAFVNCVGFREYRRKRVAGKDAMQRRPHFGLPRSSDRVILQNVEDADGTVRRHSAFELARQVGQPEARQLGARCGNRCVEMVQQIAPALACVREQLARFTQPLAE